MQKALLFVAIGLATGMVTRAADPDIKKLPAPAAKTDVTFAADIKPIFEKSCVKCHGPEKQKAKLRVDSLEAIEKGGEDGDILSVGKSEKSHLVHSVARILDEDENMPSEGKGEPLTKEQVALVRAWIDQGAK